ncbi:MAG: flagellar protein [bacterium]|nr:flagellar protein [bacterium]
MEAIRNGFLSIEQVTDRYLKKEVKDSPKQSEISFDEVLREKQAALDPLKFSKHAANRLNARNINLSESQNQRLLDGVSKASAKGINESLVLVDSLAFIVNVPNKTVVTAMDQADAGENVFTNIDGAVIA